MSDDTKAEPLPSPEVFFRRPRTLARLGKGAETIEGCAERLATERDVARSRIEELEGALRIVLKWAEDADECSWCDADGSPEDMEHEDACYANDLRRALAQTQPETGGDDD